MELKQASDHPVIVRTSFYCTLKLWPKTRIATNHKIKGI